ncbi:MAG: serine/threonine protein kinase [Planctomycetota bacterium]
MSDYKIGRPVGKGARSVIYKMKHKDEDMLLAGKFVRTKDDADQRVMKHLKNENKVLRKLSAADSPPSQIVRRYDFITFRRFFFLQGACLLLQYIPGNSLQAHADYRLHKKLDILVQVCEALEFMHQNDYIHADLKPDNIIVTPEGHAKLIDFGFAAPIGSKQTGVKGTTGYLAPEQKGGTLDPSTDVFNLGAVMYWLTTGDKLPYVAGGTGTAPGAANSPTINPSPPHHLNRNVPEDLSSLILDCCDPQRGKRPPLRRLKGQLHDVALRIKMQT